MANIYSCQFSKGLVIFPKRRAEYHVEMILKEILTELKDLKTGMKDIKKDHGQKLKNLETAVNGIIDEHGQMLRAILESKEVQRGEIDTLTHRTAKIEGTIKGAAKQVLEDLRVSNQ